MHPASAMIATLCVVLARAAEARAQAGRYIPLPPSGGGGRFLPFLPPYLSDAIIWYVLAFLAVCFLVVVGWQVGLGIGVALRHGLRQPESSWSTGASSWNACAPPADLILQPHQVAAKAGQTRLLLEFLAHQDPALDPGKLQEEFTSVFLRVQKAWEARDYQPVRDQLEPILLARHESLLTLMRQNHEINRIDNLHIEQLELVHLHCSKILPLQEVTALITFRASVYFVNDRTGSVTRGLRTPCLFQEFWVFRRRGNGWCLLNIERSHESERLKRPNFVEGLTATQLANAQTSITL